MVATYSFAPLSFAEVRAKYEPRIVDGGPIRPTVFSVDGEAAGYLQTYRVADFPEYAAAVGDRSDAVAIDLLIGEAKWLRMGLGTRAIATACAEIVWPVYDAARCIATPRIGNLASVHAFAKAGFVAIRTIIEADGESARLMERTRQAAQGDPGHC